MLLSLPARLFPQRRPKEFAFRHFAGKVLFINSPFPSLRKIQHMSFSGMTHAQSRVEIINQPVLEMIGVDAFHDTAAAAIVKGNLKSLRYIEDGAFQAGVDDCCNQSVVDLVDMPSLLFIATSAFFGYRGTLKIAGSLPALETIGPTVSLISKLLGQFAPTAACSPFPVSSLGFFACHLCQRRMAYVKVHGICEGAWHT